MTVYEGVRWRRRKREGEGGSRRYLEGRRM